MLITCLIKGKLLRLQGDPRGIKKGEYCFQMPEPVVAREDCDECEDVDCPYGFNLEALLENKSLKKKVLDYLCDASLDDELLLNGVGVRRLIQLFPGGKKGKIYSHTCFDEKTGRVLMALDDKCNKKFSAKRKAERGYVKAVMRLLEVLDQAKPLPPRVIKRRG